MQRLGLESYEQYLDYLEGNPDEFVELFDAILINVTSFFRDREAWDYLDQHVVSQNLSPRSPRRRSASGVPAPLRERRPTRLR